MIVSEQSSFPCIPLCPLPNWEGGRLYELISGSDVLLIYKKTSRNLAGFEFIKRLSRSNHLFDELDLLVDESDDDDEEDEDEESSEVDEEPLLLPLLLLPFLLDSEDFSLLSFLESLDSEPEVNRDAPFEEDRLSVT